MKIQNFVGNFCPNKNNNNKNKIDNLPPKSSSSNPSFNGIYVEDIINIGDVAERNLPPKFLPKDALLLNAIADEYPNQDCFIKKGYAGRPMLEYRERPPQVQVFTETLAREYKTSVDYKNKEYPTEPLILYKDSMLNRFIGMTNYIALNPSLPYTVKVGYELHKKLLDKKFKIMEVIGKNNNVNLGTESVIKRAHKAIADTEIAVTRYLMECSLAALTDRASAQQIYASNYPKVQSRLEEKRKLDLTTSLADMPEAKVMPENSEDIFSQKIDICEAASEFYPDKEENTKRIKEIANYMAKKGITL